MLAMLIIACIADEWTRMEVQMIKNLETYSAPSASSSTPPPLHSLSYPSLLHRWSFILSCLLISISAIFSHLALVFTTLLLSLGTLTWMMFQQIETPRSHVRVLNTEQRGAKQAQDEAAETARRQIDPLAPPLSQLLQPTVLASAHCFLSVLLPLFGLWYCSFLFSHGLLILSHPSSPGHGVLRLVYVIFVTAGGENGGMGVGAMMGRTKLTPRISPNKSREGAAAQIVVSAIVSAIFAWSSDNLGISVLESIPLGCALGLVGMLGDLFESLLKRAVGVKDAGTIIPGAGGMLDRMDGLIFNLPFFYYYLEYVHRTA